MKKMIYNLFLIAGIIGSALGFTKVEAAATPLVEPDSVENIIKNDNLYFSDILERQTGQSNLLAYHYSHGSHGSHGSHRSHTSHYSSRY